jgi:acetyltransferase-like isoleucine patch superfamily enzyme
VSCSWSCASWQSLSPFVDGPTDPFYSQVRQDTDPPRHVFINLGCRFQDTGGITIGDGTLIGRGRTLTTLNHRVDPELRADVTPAPIVIGRQVWLGAFVAVVPGVTIGDGAIVGARAVVTQSRATQHHRGRRTRQGHPRDWFGDSEN